jgi:hypothetical protein
LNLRLTKKLKAYALAKVLLTQAQFQELCVAIQASNIYFLPLPMFYGDLDDQMTLHHDKMQELSGVERMVSLLETHLICHQSTSGTKHPFQVPSSPTETQMTVPRHFVT